MVKGSGVAAGLSEALAPWLRNQPEVYGLVASDPTISRLFKVLSAVSPEPAMAGSIPPLLRRMYGAKPAKTPRCTASAWKTLLS